MAVELGGVRIGVRLTASSLLPGVLSVLPRGWRRVVDGSVPILYSLVAGGSGPWRGARRYHVLYEGGRLICRAFDIESVLSALEHDVAHQFACGPSDDVRLWTPAVSWKNRVILLPGPTGNGRRTLLSALSGLGAGVLSSGGVVVDAAGRVRPYLPAVVAGAELPWQPLGTLAAYQPKAVAAVVMTRYRAGGRWRPASLDARRGALELLAYALDIQGKPRERLAALRHLAERAIFLRGTRGEATEAARRLLDALDTAALGSAEEPR